MPLPPFTELRTRAFTAVIGTRTELLLSCEMDEIQRRRYRLHVGHGRLEARWAAQAHRVVAPLPRLMHLARRQRMLCTGALSPVVAARGLCGRKKRRDDAAGRGTL